jgi:hypothetical protein
VNQGLLRAWSEYRIALELRNFERWLYPGDDRFEEICEDRPPGLLEETVIGTLCSAEMKLYA